MNVYTQEQFDEIATYTAQKMKESQSYIINQRTGQPEKYWSGTQAQYDAIPTVDPDTRYWITP